MNGLSLYTASDDRHCIYLLNAIIAYQRVEALPKLHVLDLGLSESSKRLLRALCPKVILLDVDRSIPHWRQNWTWKMLMMQRAAAGCVLYLDLPNLALLRSPKPLFDRLSASGHLLFENGQILADITPSDYYAKFGLDSTAAATHPVFGAGVVGFDSRRPEIRAAIGAAYEAALQGLTLGRSATEHNPAYGPHGLIRDCRCFRADQTLLNLAFRRHVPGLVILPSGPALGNGGRSDSPGQLFWYARKNPEVFEFSTPLPQAILGAGFSDRLRFVWRVGQIRSRQRVKGLLERFGLLSTARGIVRGKK